MTSAYVPSASGGQPHDDMVADDEPLVELRCAVALFRGDSVLLVERCDRGDWVLPGGTPRQHESMASCARRETWEETGLDVNPNRCGLVLEVNDPIAGRRIVELVFVADEFDASAPLATEPGRWLAWVRFDDLTSVTLRPPIAEYLPGLARRRGVYARYLDNMWRPEPVDP